MGNMVSGGGAGGDAGNGRFPDPVEGGGRACVADTVVSRHLLSNLRCFESYGGGGGEGEMGREMKP